MTIVTEPNQTDLVVGSARAVVDHEPGESPALTAWFAPSTFGDALSLNDVTFSTPQDVRDAAALLLLGAEELEARQASAAGRRLFDCAWDKHTFTADEWWIGEQTDHRRDEVRLFAIPATGEKAAEYAGRKKTPIEIGTRWGKPVDKHGEPDFTHVIIGKGRLVSEFRKDGVPYVRYVEIHA